jgi:hypothetical protein
MKAPVVLVTATLPVTILLAASFLIATGTRGEVARERANGHSASKTRVNALMALHPEHAHDHL